MQKKKRRRFNTSLDEELYIELKVLALRKRFEINQLLEEGMKYVIEKIKWDEIFINRIKHTSKSNYEKAIFICSKLI